jgi:hypothetical protein
VSLKHSPLPWVSWKGTVLSVSETTRMTEQNVTGFRRVIARQDVEEYVEHDGHEGVVDAETMAGDGRLLEHAAVCYYALKQLLSANGADEVLKAATYAQGVVSAVEKGT